MQNEELDILDEDNSGLDSIDALEGLDLELTSDDELLENVEPNEELNVDSELEFNDDIENNDLQEFEADDSLNELSEDETELDSAVESQDELPEDTNNIVEQVNEDENSFGDFTTVASPSLDNLEDILNEENIEVDSTNINNDDVAEQENDNNSKDQI